MGKLLVSMIAMLAISTVSGCNNPKPPNTVANDVAKAQAKAATEVANANQDAAKDESKAEAKVADKTNALNDVTAQGAYDVAVARADGEHKIALQKCDALGGDAQKACKDRAEADYDLAKADAKSTLAMRKP
jgi:hypothetical protein